MLDVFFEILNIVVVIMRMLLSRLDPEVYFPGYFVVIAIEYVVRL